MGEVKNTVMRQMGLEISRGRMQPSRVTHDYRLDGTNKE